MNQDLYDVIIIGGGPAGLSAGIYASRARLKTGLIERGRTGGQAATTEEMENYPGFPETTGPNLMDRFAEHAKHFGTEFIRDEVVALESHPEFKLIRGKKGEYRSKTVIIAVGAEPRTLGVKGEGQFRGKGVSYCATCDADFYTDLDVVIIGNGDAAIEEALYLTKFVNKATIIVVHDEGILDATKIIQERAFANPKIEFVWNSVLEEIRGDGIVEEVVIKNIKNGELTTLECNGVFIFVGTVPKTGFCQGVVEMDQRGYIRASDLMETSVDGIYVVGDCRQKYLRQVVTAAADGAIAAVAAEKYLHEEEGFREQVLDQKVPVLVNFWNVTHEDSMAMIGIVEDVAAGYGDRAKVVKIDTYKNQRVARRYNVTQVPTLLCFVGGQVVETIQGKVEASVIKQALDKVVK
ncbi:MAG: thioredoxin-disulfide reductase [Bacillota bacterium]